MLRMRNDLVADPSDAKSLRASQSAMNEVLGVSICDEYDQVLHSLQLKTPAANRTPKSGSPRRQSLNAGCSDPSTMSVAPVASFAKHRTCSGFIMLSATAL